MNNEAIVVKPLYLNEPKMALKFLVEKLGFVIQGHSDSNATNAVMICDSFGNFYEVILNTKDETGKDAFEPVVHTADCLQDFYNMEMKGITLLNRPRYIAEGLMFEISDPWNNTYTFLEKRDYTDQ